MVVLIPIAIERMLHERKPGLKVLAALAAVLCTLTVVFTFSRGGFLAAVVVLGLFALIYPPRPLQLALLIALAMGIFFLVPSTYFDRILTLDSLLPSQTGTIDIRTDNSIQGRASQYLTAWAMFKQHPLLGVGLSNFAYLYPEFSKEVGLAPSVSNRSVHSLYLEVLTETGILGMSIFLSIIGLSFRSILSARTKFLEVYKVDYAHLVTGLGIGFAGYLTAALFIHAAFPRYFYLLIGIILSLPAVAEQVQRAATAERFRINLSQ
jgi:O-antigen ligase